MQSHSQLRTSDNRHVGLARAWFMAPAARAALARIRPADLRIVESRPIVGPDRYVWSLDERTSLRLHDLRGQGISAELGYSFEEVGTAANFDRDKAAAWLDLSAAVPSVNDALIARFGNPHELSGLGVHAANRAYQQAPGCLLPVAECAA